jgi:PBP1b-binding outer membrane lipoprotein LpoB
MFKKVSILIALMFALVLSGCSVKGTDTPAPSASAAQPVEATTATPVETPTDTVGTLKFGQVRTYEDGVSISVSTPKPFTPNAEAMGATPGQKAMVYTIVITNGSKVPLRPSAYANVSSAGAESSMIADVGNPIGSIGSSPSGTILPGKTIKWLEGYSIADPKDVTFQVSPGFKYEDAIFVP